MIRNKPPPKKISHLRPNTQPHTCDFSPLPTVSPLTELLLSRCVHAVASFPPMTIAWIHTSINHVVAAVILRSAVIIDWFGFVSLPTSALIREAYRLQRPLDVSGVALNRRQVSPWSLMDENILLSNRASCWRHFPAESPDILAAWPLVGAGFRYRNDTCQSSAHWYDVCVLATCSGLACTGMNYVGATLYQSDRCHSYSTTYRNTIIIW